MRPNVERFIGRIQRGELTNDELEAVQTAINERQEAAQPKSADYEHGYDQGAFDMWQHFAASLNRFQTPAANAAIEASFVIGLICGLPLAGHGEGTRAAVGASIDVLTHYMNVVERENRSFRQGFIDSLNMEVGEMPYGMTNGMELREAMVAYYSGEDKEGRRFARFLRTMPFVKELLELKYEYTPGKEADIQGLLLDQAIAQAKGQTYHQKVIAVRDALTLLDENGILSEQPNGEQWRVVLAKLRELTNEPTRIAKYIGNRQSKFKQRTEKL